MNSLPLPKGKRSFDQSSAGHEQPQYEFLPMEPLGGIDPNVSMNAVEAGLAYPAQKKRHVSRPTAASPPEFTLTLPTGFNFTNPTTGNPDPSMDGMNGNMTVDPQLGQCDPVRLSQGLGDSIALHHTLSQTAPTLTGRKISGYTLEEVGLVMPANLSNLAYQRILGFIDQEVARQEANPPILPKSKLPEMAAKPLPEAPYEIPDDDPRLAKILLEKNKVILQKSKALDKERNNLAAKATRERRAEALVQTRELLNQREVEANWWKLRAVTLGASPEEYGSLGDKVRQAMLSTMEKRLVECEQKKTETSAKNKSQKQSTRTASSNKHVQKDKEAKAKEVARLKAELEAQDAAEQAAQQAAQQTTAGQQQLMVEPFQQEQKFNQQPTQVAAAA